MMNETREKTDIPVIRRADGFFLYTPDGDRLLDFYQDNGRAVLGHRLDGMQRVIKSTVSKGLLASYPAGRERKAVKALSGLFPGAVSFGIYPEKGELLRALARMSGISVEDVVLSDPLAEDSGSIALWRPFLGNSGNNAPVEVPVLPFPGGIIPSVAVVYEKGIDPGEPRGISPFLLEILNRTVHLLSGTAIPEDPGHYSRFDSSLWDRKGPYLVFRVKGKRYELLHSKALEAGILLPPSSGIPGIIPLRYEYGQVKKFLKVIKEME